MVNLLPSFAYLLFIVVPSVGFDTDDNDKCGIIR